MESQMTENIENSISPEEYKSKQRERLSAYVVGGKDIIGNPITHVYSKGDEFVVYGISGVSDPESFRVIVDTEDESDPKGLIRNFESIKEDLAEFRSILYKGVHDKSIKHRAANAISTAIRGDIEIAKSIFTKIKEQVAEEYQSILFGRMLYISGAFAFLLLVSLVAIVFYIFRDSGFVTHVPYLKNIAYASAFAGCGGLLSVCTNFQRIEFERELKLYAYFAYGAQRIIIAMLCGIFSYTLIVGGLIFSFVMKSEHSYIAIMSLCVASGFSETVIPNALKKLESKG